MRKGVLKGVTYLLEPTADQKIYFEKTFGCARFIYNALLADRIQAYAASKNGTSTQMIYPTPAQYKQQHPFLKEIDSLALANAQLNLDKAYKNFFKDPKNNGFPQFKKKGVARFSYRTNNQKGTIRFNTDNTYLKLPKLKTMVRIKCHRQPLSDQIKSATVFRKNTKYYVSILFLQEIEELVPTDRAIGLDLGLIDFVTSTSSDGRHHKVKNPKHYESLVKKLKKEQRILSRRALLAKQRGVHLSRAKNYQKQKVKVAKIQAKIANQRKDFLQKLSTEIVKNHDVICIENLSVKNMLKNKKHSKAISRAGWSVFTSMLNYKSEWHGRTIVEVGRFFASTQLCSACGQSDGKKPTHIRDWTCPYCGASHDRDINASINILNEGLRLNALS